MRRKIQPTQQPQAPVEPQEAQEAVKPVPVEWKARENFRPFGDRLSFLSPEVQHLTTGRLMVLPAKEKRYH